MPSDYDDEFKAVGLRSPVMPEIRSSGLAVGPVFPYDDRDTYLGDGVSIRQSDQDEVELFTEDDTHIYIRISDVLPNLVQWLADLPVEARGGSRGRGGCQI